MSKIILLFRGDISESELSENDLLYLVGLSRDVYFVQFLARLGRRALTLAVAMNLGVPQFSTDRDVLPFKRTPFNGIACEVYAKTTLRMFSTPNMDAQIRLTVIGCVRTWLMLHEFELKE